MTQTIRIDRLEKIYEANVGIDPCAHSQMDFAIRTECGTTHCLFGNYLVANPECGLWLKWHANLPEALLMPSDGHAVFYTVARHLGIDEADAKALFGQSKDNLRVCLARLRNFIDARKPAAPTIPTMDIHREQPSRCAVETLAT